MVRDHSAPGILYRRELPVPQIPRSVSESGIFLYASKEHAEARVGGGGSGFLLGILTGPTGHGLIHLYAVTNDHVRRSCPVVRLTNGLGATEIHDWTADSWREHPKGDDVAVRAFGAVPMRRYRYILNDSLLPRDGGPYRVGPGDDCVMVGRYINLSGQQFDRSTVRFGNIAMMPALVRQRLRAFDQESFLVDMRSVPGYSGSQVIVYFNEPPIRADSEEEAQELLDRAWSGVMGRAWLLGIDWGQVPVVDDLLSEDGTKVIGRVRLPTGMAGIVPAWKLAELLEEPERVKPEREAAEAEAAEFNENDAVLHHVEVETVNSESDNPELENFDRTLHKLVNTPKPKRD
jgi:hypothetical protein